MESLDLQSGGANHPRTWLLEASRHLNVAIEMIDDEWQPLLPAGSDATAAALRTQLTTEGSRLRSTIAMVTPEGPEAIAIDGQLFVCRAVAGAGTLILSRTIRAGGAPAEEIRLELEAIAAWLVRGIESSFSDGCIDPTVDSHMVASLRRLLDEAAARGSVRGVVSAFVETVAVWLEIDVHAYVADSGGRFSHTISPVGADHAAVPTELDDDVVPADPEIVRLPPSERHRFEFTSMPDDVLIRRIVTGVGSWVLLFAGTIDRRDEARLTVLSDLFRGTLKALTSETVAPATATIPERSSQPAAAQSDRGERRTAHRSFQAWIERLASQAVQEGGQASVIVISIPDEDVRPEFIQAQVTRIRNDLRPSDFAGSLAGGEIGVLLRDTPADRAAAVAARLEKLLQWDVNTGKAIQPSIGVACCSPASRFTGSILHAARENGAARTPQ